MIIKSIKQKITEYFFLNPTIKLRVRQIERELNVPLPSVIRYVKELVNEQILKKVSVSNVVMYSADRNSKKYLLKKKLFNIKSLYDLTEYLVEKFSNPNIILFGSYFRGEDIENSDIDLYIEIPTKSELKLNEFEKKLHRKIQLLVHKNIREIKNKELANNIINGIVLNGFVEVF